MFRYKRWLCVLLVGSLVAVSYGAARKIRAFERFDPESVEADGMAILNYAQGEDKTIVQVILSDFSQDEYYVVLILGAGGQYYVDRSVPEIVLTSVNSVVAAVGADGSLQADGKGHVTLHHTVPGDCSQADIAIVTLADWADCDPADPAANTVIVRGLGGSRAQL